MVNYSEYSQNRNAKVSGYQLISGLVLIFLGILIGYLLSDRNIESVVEPSKNQGESICEVPECYLGLCPRYYSMEVDGDGISESVVVVPTRMTKGAGKVLVIDEGKIVFESEELSHIGVVETGEDNPKGNKLPITYSNSGNSEDLMKKVYIYQDGVYQLAE